MQNQALMLKNSIRLVAVSAMCAVGALSAKAVNTYQGPDGGYLNDPDNWISGLPTTDRLGFRDMPSSEYTVKLSEDLQTNGGVTTDGGNHTVHFDLAPYLFRVLGDYPIQHRNATHVLESGTWAMVGANGETNTMSFASENASNSTFIVRNKGTMFIGNVSMMFGGGNVTRIENGAVMHGTIGVVAASNTAYVSGAGTLVDFHSEYNPVTGSSPGTRILLLGAYEGGSRSGCERACRMYVTDGATVTNVTALRIGHSQWSGRAGTDCLLCVSNATFHMTRTSGENILGGSMPEAHGNRIEFVDGAQVVMGGSGSGHNLDVGTDGSYSNTLYIAGRGTFVSDSWSGNDWPIVAGPNGSYNAIEITDHAFAKFGGLASGGQCKGSMGSYTSVWNRVTVSDGAVVETSTLYCGQRHADQKVVAMKSVIASNLVEITSGAIVTNKSNSATVIGCLAPARDNTLRVSGPGSLLATAQVLVGYWGARGNRLEILDGGQVTTLTGTAPNVYVPGEWGGSNNAVVVRNATFAANRMDIGRQSQEGWTSGSDHQEWSGTGGNALEVGSDADVSVYDLIFWGPDNRLLVSNGTLRITHNLSIDTSDTAVRCFSCRFEGSAPEVLLSGVYGNPFGAGASLTFAIPSGGYATVPFVSDGRPLTFAADASLNFELSSAFYDRGGMLTLMKSTKAHFAAPEGWLAAQAAKLPRDCRLYFSTDGMDVEPDPTKANYLMLHVPRHGLMLIFR